MKKTLKAIFTVALAVGLTASVAFTTGCTDDSKVINVCASEVPHADVLENCVKDILAEKGYTLKVKVLDWTMQNSSVANGDYDANYFQHVPYLSSDTAASSLFATCKVHYEPLGIYYGKATNGAAVTSGKSFEICNDESNAIRAFQLLEAKGVFSISSEGNNYPIKENGTELNFAGNNWTSSNNVKVTLIAEELLVSSMADYDFACLPCNTAYHGNVNSTKRAAVEDDAAQVSAKANILAARSNDYNTNEAYKAKIDALTDALLSEKVSSYFETKYLGAMTCDGSTQIDLRK